MVLLQALVATNAYATVFQYGFSGAYVDLHNTALSGTVTGMFQLDTAEQPVRPLSSSSSAAPGYLFFVARESLSVNGIALDTSPYSTGFGQSSADKGAGISYIVNSPNQIILNMTFSEAITNPQIIQPVPAPTLTVLSSAIGLPGNACSGPCLVFLSTFKQTELMAEPWSISLFAGGLGALFVTRRTVRRAS